jgi:hypothetical protein
VRRIRGQVEAIERWTLPGAPFYVAAGLLAAALPLAARAPRRPQSLLERGHAV